MRAPKQTPLLTLKFHNEAAAERITRRFAADLQMGERNADACRDEGGNKYRKYALHSSHHIDSFFTPRLGTS